MSGERHERYVILLRAIGPVTHRLMSMADWRNAAETAGFVEPVTLGNTGNMLARFGGTASEAAEVTVGLLRGFGLGENVVPVIRPTAVLEHIVQAIGEDIKDPAQTAVYFFAAHEPDFAWVEDFAGPERLRIMDGHPVVDFTADLRASSRLMRQIDKNCGLSTARNWNTVRSLAERAAATGKKN